MMTAASSQTALLLTVLHIICLAAVRSEGLESRGDAFIGYSEEAKARCIDQQSDCASWKDGKACIINPNFMRAQCAKTCGSCKGIDLRAQGRITGAITVVDSKEFSALYPALATQPVGQSHFRYDPSLSELQQLGDSMRTRPWITLGSLGIGTYLGNEDEETDEQVASAIIKSVAHGCNVIDTARNYRHGRGEDSVHKALMYLLQHGINRRSLFVSTKAGFMPDDLTKDLLAKGSITPSDLHSGNCIHPACLRASLEQSLVTLNLEAVDLLYLHNAAEMQLGAVGKRRFVERLAAAFREMEQFRVEGKIQAYGMATWSCFRTPLGDPGHLSLQEVWDIAARVGGKDHGFRYVQLPINAAMREAWREPWQPLEQQGQLPDGDPQMLPLTAVAARLGVGVFASGPLSEAGLLRDSGLMDKLRASPQLADDNAISSDAAAALQVARSTPYVISAIVGHKTPAHVEENLKVVQAELLNRQSFLDLMQNL